MEPSQVIVHLDATRAAVIPMEMKERAAEGRYSRLRPSLGKRAAAGLLTLSSLKLGVMLEPSPFAQVVMSFVMKRTSPKLSCVAVQRGLQHEFKKVPGRHIPEDPAGPKVFQSFV